MPNISIGDIVKGKVTGIEKYGIFVLTDNGYTGLIHISEISDKFVRNVYDYVRLDEEIKSKVIGIDDENKKYKLSIKNFNYRMSGDSLENDNGFSTLKSMLPSWIEEYKNKEE
ncbi:MAG: S1 RNA-binding domain-containing protein [Bacilli bacterium]|nr:S1 RNA-binding domain-containing protein [Bacilli bacterium]